MFDESVPSELRRQLAEAFSARHELERVLTWIAAFSGAPEEFYALLRDEFGRMEARAWDFVARYQRGELTLNAFEERLEAEFSWDRAPSPELEAWLARTAESRTD